jgi:hypothetical protein
MSGNAGRCFSLPGKAFNSQGSAITSFQIYFSFFLRPLFDEAGT